MPDPVPAQLIDDVRALALKAGAETLKWYRGDFEVREKEDASPVTEADEAAEAIIVAGLKTLTPGIPIVAEEMMAAGAEVTVGDWFWLVDPLDGTREFVDRRDEFTVNIGLIHGNEPVMGVVYAPALDTCYWGLGPGTAQRQRDGGAVQPIQARTIPASGAVVTASRRHGDKDKLEALLGTLKVESFVTAGSSLKFCLLAAGEADIYPRYGPTSEWDTAAAHAVLAAAGGAVETTDGAPLAYGKPNFRNPEFIAWGRRG